MSSSCKCWQSTLERTSGTTAWPSMDVWSCLTRVENFYDLGLFLERSAERGRDETAVPGGVLSGEELRRLCPENRILR